VTNTPAPTNALPRGAEVSLPEVVGADFVLTSVETLSGGLGNQAGSVHSLRGHQASRDRSVVLKVTRPAAPGSSFPVIGTIPQGWGLTPDHSHYWRREARFYSSDLPSHIAGPHARTPRPLLVEDRDDEAWIWLEALDDLKPGPWTHGRLVEAAYQIARLQACARDVGLPAHGAVRPRLLRAYVDELLASNIAAAGRDATWEHPLVTAVLPGGDAQRLRRLFADRARMLDALERMPSLLTHHDAHRRNILTIENSASVLIDWAYAGTGAPGEELGSLVGMTIMLGEVDTSDMRATTNESFDAYQRGLYDEGWRGDTSHVTFAGHATCALQAGLITSSLAVLTSPELDEDPSLMDVFEEQVPHLRGLLHHFLWNADQAWEALERL
jgi:hypothetical protein